MLMGALKTIINKPLKINFDSTSIGNIKSCKKKLFFSFSIKKFMKKFPKSMASIKFS